MILEELWQLLFPGDVFIERGTYCYTKVDFNTFEFRGALFKYRSHSDMNITDYTSSPPFEDESVSDDYEDNTETIEFCKCKCDFYSVVLPYGCQCGGK